MDTSMEEREQINEITDRLMESYVEGNIPESIMRQWTRQIVAKDFEQFKKYLLIT